MTSLRFAFAVLDTAYALPRLTLPLHCLAMPLPRDTEPCVAFAVPCWTLRRRRYSLSCHVARPLPLVRHWPKPKRAM